MPRRRSLRKKDWVRLLVLVAVALAASVILGRLLASLVLGVGCGLLLSLACLLLLPSFEYLRVSYLPRRFRTRASLMRSQLSAYYSDSELR